jgi:hypothetical protein
MKPNREICGYYDASIWESAQKQGKVALKRLINSGEFKMQLWNAFLEV